jgi:AraC family transcriptional regulator
MSVRLSSGRFYGTARRRIGLGGLNVIESAYREGVELPLHDHQNPHFCFVLDGVYEERLGRRWVRRTSADMAWYPAEVSHAERHLASGRHLLVEIDHGQLAELLEDVDAPREPIDLRGSRATLLARLLHRELGIGDDVSPLAMHGLVLEMTAEACRFGRNVDERDTPRWLRAVHGRLEEEFRDPPSLDELAADAGVHRAHLARVFRSRYGCTVGERIRRLRIEFACERLAGTGDPLATIAIEAGFADQSHFSRSFRAVTGVTPGVFRMRRS